MESPDPRKHKGLGIASFVITVVDRTSKKVFPILGIVIGAAVLLGSAAIVAIGFAVRA
jgi:hypothetical protein